MTKSEKEQEQREANLLEGWKICHLVPRAVCVAKLASCCAIFSFRNDDSQSFLRDKYRPPVLFPNESGSKEVRDWMGAPSEAKLPSVEHLEVGDWATIVYASKKNGIAGTHFALRCQPLPRQRRKVK